ELRFPTVPEAKREKDAIAVHLARLVGRDPLLRLSFDRGTAEHVLAGPSEAYVRSAVLPLEGHSAFRSVTPRGAIAYQQRLVGECELESRFVKHCCHGNYAVVRVRVRGEPSTESLHFENRSDLEPGFVSAFEHGLREAASSGGRVGAPFTGLEVLLLGA